MLLLLHSSRPKRFTLEEIRSELARDGYPVDVNTIRRNLEMLSGLFPLVCDNSVKPHKWYWMPGAKGPLDAMSLSEAMSLALLEDLLGPLLPVEMTSSLEERFEQARDKLRELKRNQNIQWRDLVRYVPPGLPFPPPALAGGVLEAVQDALLRKRKLRVAYRGVGKPQPGERILDPLAFIQLGERSYLVAGEAESPDPKTFALHRIEEAEALDEQIHGWDGFALDEYLQNGNAQFGAGGMITLRARIHERLKQHFEESPIAEDQKLSAKNGEWFVSATVRDTLQLEFWILSWSFYIEVLEPVELRKRIQSRFKNALSGYGDESIE
jgi:predicted DNA-binding transcriptional regulator YafY